MTPPPFADPALAGVAPRPRPEAVLRAAETAAATAPTPETPALSAAEQAEIARLGATRPRPRPAGIAAAARAADNTEAQARAEAEALAAAEAAAAALAARPDPFANATANAVTLSRRPASKPGDMAAIISRAERNAAAAAPTPAAAPAPVAAAAAPAPKTRAPAPTDFSAPTRDDEIDEPEPTAAAPKLPTSASVAKQATTKNAIQLGEMNLIGLFGSASNRRALVRMSNGKFVKVGVGDRLDGGKVTAIGTDRLTYAKGSRNYTLQLLKGE
jgi:hypothetical protein